MNRLDQNLLSDLSSINSNYSSNNLLENYKYGQAPSSQNGNYSNAAFNNYDQMDESEEFHNFASDQSNEEDNQLPDLQEQLKRERRIKKNLQNRLMQLQAAMKKKQLHENEKLCKKRSNSLTGGHLRNSLQNRRFEGDGSEDDDLQNAQTKISKSRLNYQSAVNYHPNNCPNNFRGGGGAGGVASNSFQSNSLSYPNGHLNDLNDHLNDRQYPGGNRKFMEIDKLIKIIKQEQVLNDLNGQMAKNSLNDDCSSSLNSRGSLTKNQIKNNNLANHAAHSNLDNQSINSLDGHHLMNNGHHLVHQHALIAGGQANDLCLNEHHLKKQIVASMKNNFHSMIEFIESQVFAQDQFMAIQQLINLIMMQNCQFMNHQQVLLCWLQKLQFQLCASQPARSPPVQPAAYHHLPNNLASSDATGDPNALLADTPLNEHQLNGAAGQQLNNSKITGTLNNNQPTETNLIKNTNHSFYDNLKSHHHSLPPMYQNQLSKLKNSQVPANFKLNNKLKQSSANKSASELKEMYNLIKELIEDKHNATGKPNNYLSHPTEFGEFGEPGAVGGIEELDELGDLTDNLHSNNLTKHQPPASASNLNNAAGNHLVSNGHSNIASGANSGVAANNKSPQMILNLPSSGPAAVRKKTTVSTVNSTVAAANQRKNAPDVIESISCSDDLIKSHSTESIRPLMAAEGRSSEFNPNQPPTTLLQTQVAKTINNGGSAKISSTISSSSAINGQTPIVVSAASSTNNVLLKRPPTTGAARRNDFQNDNDDNDDTEETSDDDLANRNQVTTPEAQSSENENKTANASNQLPNSNQNAVPPFLENAALDAEQLVDGQLGFTNLNGRNDSEIRLSGDGI